jgi:hypothetical protein
LETDFELVGRVTSPEKTPTILKKEGGSFIPAKQRTINTLKCMACGGVIRDIYIQGKITGTEIPKPKEEKKIDLPKKDEETKKEGE